MILCIYTRETNQSREKQYYDKLVISVKHS
jgi:hypothetical protein